MASEPSTPIPPQGPKRPEQVSNRPTPKEEPKSGSSFVGKVLSLVVALVLIFAGVTMNTYAGQVGSPPWSWSGDQWSSYLSFSRDAAKQASDKIKDKVKSVDWAKVKTKITEKTKMLWTKLTEMESKIEMRLKTERQKRVAAARARKAPESETDTAVPEASQPAVKSRYEEALEEMRDAVRFYRNSPNSNSAIKKAADAFKRAKAKFESALAEVPTDQKPEIESMIRECNQYIYDCMKRQKL